MKLLIAIELPRSFITEVGRIQKELKFKCCGGRFVDLNGLYMNLHLIGDSEDLAGAVAAMQEAARGIKPFTLHLGKYMSVERNGLRTSSIEIKGELAELNVLHECLGSALYDKGFSREMKRFSPHITIGRSVQYDEIVETEMKALSPNASMTVFGITLFESVKQDGRTVYRALHKEVF